MSERLSYQDSCCELQSHQIIDAGEIPLLPQQPPRHDDEVPGVSFFRTELANVKIENMTLPRTFFGRSEIRDSSFKGTNLSESTANWNDFINVDFSNADISYSDFRACIFDGVQFNQARLENVDFRHCTFTNCDFSGADLAGAKLVTKLKSSILLSSEQVLAIDWQTDDGEEPEGG